MLEREVKPIGEKSIVTDITAPTYEMLRIIDLPEAEQQTALVALEEWLHGQFEVLKGMTGEGEWSAIPHWVPSGAHMGSGERRILPQRILEAPLYFDVDGIRPDLVNALFLQTGYGPYMTRAEFYFNPEDDGLASFKLTDRSLASSVIKVGYSHEDGFALTRPEPRTRQFPIIRS